MSSSNCCFLICIQLSQKEGQVVWYSHLLKNFSQFIVIHTVKGFGIVNKAEIDIFLELSCFFDIYIHITWCKTASGKSLYNMGSSTQCFEMTQAVGWGRSGKEIQKEGTICTTMANSRCCMVETNTTLQSNYPLIENNFVTMTKKIATVNPLILDYC